MMPSGEGRARLLVRPSTFLWMSMYRGILRLLLPPAFQAGCSSPPVWWTQAKPSTWVKCTIFASSMRHLCLEPETTLPLFTELPGRVVLGNPHSPGPLAPARLHKECHTLLFGNEWLKRAGTTSIPLLCCGLKHCA